MLAKAAYRNFFAMKLHECNKKGKKLYKCLISRNDSKVTVKEVIAHEPASACF